MISSQGCYYHVLAVVGRALLVLEVMHVRCYLASMHGLIMYYLDVYMGHEGLILKYTSDDIAVRDSQPFVGQDVLVIKILPV